MVLAFGGLGVALASHASDGDYLAFGERVVRGRPAMIEKGGGFHHVFSSTGGRPRTGAPRWPVNKAAAAWMTYRWFGTCVSDRSGSKSFVGVPPRQDGVQKTPNELG